MWGTKRDRGRLREKPDGALQVVIQSINLLYTTFLVHKHVFRDIGIPTLPEGRAGGLRRGSSMLRERPNGALHVHYMCTTYKLHVLK